MNQYIEIEIKKPLYGSFVYIREEFLKKAMNQNTFLKVTIPQGQYLVDPRTWMASGKRMEKVFKIPTRPMILWGNEVKLT